MRVIAGSAKGRRLDAPKNYDTRPTNERVKESIFNIIQTAVPGARVLDLFSGTGQLGIEALSRGADFCVFVDEANDMINLTRKNVHAAGFDGQADIVRSGAAEYVARGGRFDLVFLDPPYDTGLLSAALEAIIQFDILSEHGIIICESRAEQDMPEAKLPYLRGRDYRYGKIKITLYEKQQA